MLGWPTRRERADEVTKEGSMQTSDRKKRLPVWVRIIVMIVFTLVGIIILVLGAVLMDVSRWWISVGVGTFSAIVISIINVWVVPDKKSQDSIGVSKKEQKKWRWFFEVITLQDAFDAMKICYMTFFALAAIQGVLMIVFALFFEGWADRILDAFLMFTLAWLVQLRQSRTATICLMLYSIYILFLTAAALFGFPMMEFSWINIILGILAVYGAYKGIQGTFKYHRLQNTSVILKNVLIRTAVIVLYNIIWFGVLFVSMFHPTIEWLFLGTGEGTLSDDIVELIFFVPMLVLTFAGAFRVLPGTRRFSTVHIPSK